MLGALAGIASRTGVEVDGFEAAGVSYPSFGDDLRDLVAS
jgi:3-phosphoshikimate 1-carboxyvinyltransferase